MPIASILGMTTVLALFLLGGLLLMWFGPQYTLGKSVQTTIGTVASLIASIVALMQVHEEERR
jgi:membrane protein implicated in regulation of membrane protease activity